MLSLSVDRHDYEENPGELTNQRTIAEYSVTVNRKDFTMLQNPRAHARYLIEENIQDEVNFDLMKGHESFIDKVAFLRKIPPLEALCKWAINQKGDTVMEVFDEVDFATTLGVMRSIASTLYEKDSWSIVAMKCGGVILLGDHSKMHNGGKNDIGTICGYKFKQYMTTNKLNGRPDTDSPVDNRRCFKMMVRSDLIVCGETLRLCCGAEIDALRGDEPIEFKTGNYTGLSRNVFKPGNVVKFELAGIRSIVVGIKKDSTILHQVIEKSVDDIKSMRSNGKRTAECYSFLFKVLSEVKKFLESYEACEVSFVPMKGGENPVFRGDLVFKRISRDVAEEDGVTDRFKERFKL